MALTPEGSQRLMAFAASLVAELSKARDLHDIWTAVMTQLNVHFDESVIFYVKMTVGVIAVAMALVVAYGFYWLVSDPVAAKYGKEAAGGKKGGKKGAAARGEAAVATPPPPSLRAASKDASDKPAPVATAAERHAKPARVRSRELHVLQPNSTIKGFTRVGVLVTSPCQSHFLVSCRRTFKVRRYPQNEKKEFMDRGKDLSEKAFTSLGASLEDEKPDVAHAVFSSDGKVLVLGDCRRDELVVFSCPPPAAHGKVAGDFVKLWSFRLPNHTVVATLSTFGVMRDGEVLSFCDEKDCGVSLVHRTRSGLGEPVGTEQKVKIGHPTAYALSENYFAVAGTFFKDCRLHYFDIRHDMISFALHRCFNAIDLKVRIAQLALTFPGTPSNSTVEWLVVFCDDGNGYVFNVPYAARNNDLAASLVGTFSDPDFANGGAEGLTLAIRGNEYHERLVIALWGGGDVSVHAQVADLACQSNGKVGRPTPIPHLVDIHDAHDGGPVRKVCFVQHGLGLATCGEDDDGKSVRLWTLPLSS